MGSAEIQGELWGRSPQDWADLQEPMHKPLWEAMLNAAAVGEGTHFLDAGCGGGGACLLAAKRGAHVFGLDAAEALIGVAAERLPDADFRIGEMEDLPFGDQAFDAVIAANSLQYTEDRVAALRELRRVCEADGRVAVGLWSSPDKVEFRVFFKAIRDTLPEPPHGKGPFELSEPGVLEELMEQADLKVVESGEEDCPFEYPSFEAFWRANASAGPLQATLRSVNEQELIGAVHRAVEPFQASGGSIRLENRFRYVVGVVW